jgi:DNA polymerase I
MLAPTRFSLAKPAMPLSHRPVKAGDHVFLVDGSSFVFRAYFQSIRQDPKYNYRSDQLPTGAVRLFCVKLFQFIREGAAGIKPTHLAIIFDKSEHSFRREIYPEYKSNRSEPPEDLIPQFPLMRAAVRAFGLVPLEKDRYEADDLIATYARQARQRGADVLIVSADKDLMQLVGNGIAMYDPASGESGAKGAREERKIGVAEVLDYFGVPPEKVIDVQALAGDSTDHVPGARGIGIKTAAQLIAEYGDLDTLLSRAAEIKQPKRREVLTDPESVALIKLSKHLVSLACDVPIDVPLDEVGVPSPDPKKLVAFLKAMEFTTITKRAAEYFGVAAEEIEPDPAFVGPAAWRNRDGEAMPPLIADTAEVATAAPESAVGVPRKNARYGEPVQRQVAATGPGELAAARAVAVPAMSFDRAGYSTITTFDALDRVIAAAFEAGYIAVDTETSSLDAMTSELIGISLCVAPGKAAYIPLRHKGEGGDDLFAGGGLLPGQLSSDEVLARLKPLLEAGSVLKIAHNAKFDTLVFRQFGIALRPIEDTLLLSYVLDAGLTDHGMDVLSEKHLHHKPLAFGEVAGSGRTFVGFARVAIDKATEYSAEDADVTLRLWDVLKPRLPAEHMTTVYETLERPMIETLARMEARGISIDRAILSRLSGEFAQDMARLEAEIYALAGQTFNLGSTKQLSDILFGKMGLPGAKKTATGAWSTAAGVLEDLAEEGNEFAARILEWRQLAKLKSTYTDALPTYVNPKTHRVHTSYALAATTTGRLSSSEPNLQNIPIRTEAGRKIRRAFVASPGYKLISADYSQIELRLLAHIADIPQLRQAFADGHDIHAMTASEMFGVPVEGMPPEVRRRAKAINFGIVYGISAFGLANQLGIPRDEAGAYIRQYFERFPGIRAYMDETKRVARQRGYVTTIFGRKCHYPRINASNPSERAFNERAAINAPIQGSAADIIRRAMVRMDAAFEKAGLKAQMLLQVHDELVFEVPDEEVEAAIPLIRRVMIDAPHPAVQLSVPLQVEAKAARNWDEAH